MKNNYFQISGIKNVIIEIKNLIDLFFRLKKNTKKGLFFIFKKCTTNIGKLVRQRVKT